MPNGYTSGELWLFFYPLILSCDYCNYYCDQLTRLWCYAFGRNFSITKLTLVLMLSFPRTVKNGGYKLNFCARTRRLAVGSLSRGARIRQPYHYCRYHRHRSDSRQHHLLRNLCITRQQQKLMETLVYTFRRPVVLYCFYWGNCDRQPGKMWNTVEQHVLSTSQDSKRLIHWVIKFTYDITSNIFDDNLRFLHFLLRQCPWLLSFFFLQGLGMISAFLSVSSNHLFQEIFFR